MRRKAAFAVALIICASAIFFLMILWYIGRLALYGNIRSFSNK